MPLRSVTSPAPFVLRVRRVCALVLISAVVLSMQTPAHAAQTGTIRGRVVNATTGNPEAGVRVVLLESRGGTTFRKIRHQTSDDDGGYSFTDLPTGGNRAYALDARFEGGIFSGEPVVLPSGTRRVPKIRSTLRVWSTTQNPGAILIRRDDLFVVQGDDGAVAVVESVTVINQTDRAYVGRSTSDGGPAATLGFSLPNSARDIQIVDSEIERSEIRATEYGFAAAAAIPPGQSRTTFTYRLEGTAGQFELSRTALYPIIEMSVHAAEPLQVTSNRLTESGEVTLEGRRYRRWSSTESIDAAAPIQAVAVAEAGIAPLAVAGLLAVGLITVVGIGLAAARRRRTRGHPVSSLSDRREKLVAAIAELDLRHERGEVTDDEWAHLRAELKHQAIKLKTPERAS
jgi:hypothetical protein